MEIQAMSLLTTININANLWILSHLCFVNSSVETAEWTPFFRFFTCCWRLARNKKRISLRWTSEVKSQHVPLREAAGNFSWKPVSQKENLLKTFLLEMERRKSKGLREYFFSTYARWCVRVAEKRWNNRNRQDCYHEYRSSFL